MSDSNYLSGFSHTSLPTIILHVCPLIWSIKAAERSLLSKASRSISQQFIYQSHSDVSCWL